MRFKKVGFILNKSLIENSDLIWNSHTMAPSAIFYENTINVFFGGWDKHKVSRIYCVKLDPKNLRNIISYESKSVLNIGEDGHFDENGVFPGHVHNCDNQLILTYTGFQLGHKIRHYNFGGIALSNNGAEFRRISKAPILDRADEGLLVRAGQSFLKIDNLYHHVYSSGSNFVKAGEKERPSYDIYYQKTNSLDNLEKSGKLIIKHNPAVEHGLGRPQIINIEGMFYIFYTRRMLNMKYFIGCSRSKDLINWEDYNEIFEDVVHEENSFDSEMIYFPSVYYNPVVKKYQLIYCGNNFGETGIGYLELSS